MIKTRMDKPDLAQFNWSKSWVSVKIRIELVAFPLPMNLKISKLLGVYISLLAIGLALLQFPDMNKYE